MNQCSENVIIHLLLTFASWDLSLDSLNRKIHLFAAENYIACGEMMVTLQTKLGPLAVNNFILGDIRYD